MKRDRGEKKIRRTVRGKKNTRCGGVQPIMRIPNDCHSTHLSCEICTLTLTKNLFSTNTLSKKTTMKERTPPKTAFALPTLLSPLTSS